MDLRRHVLVADDEPFVGRIIKMKLEQGPFRVTLAHDGSEAWDVLQRERVDLVLLDIMMPQVSGFTVLEQMRADPRFAQTPCIVLTAAGHETHRTRAAALGATDFFTKPFSPKRLYARSAQLAGVADDEDAPTP